MYFTSDNFWLRLFTTEVAFSTKPLRLSLACSKAVIPSPSIPDLSSSTAPCKLSILIPAIFSAEPAALLIASESLLKSSSLAFAIARSPDIAS